MHCSTDVHPQIAAVDKDKLVCAVLAVDVQVPNTTQPPEGYDIHAEIKLEVPVEHGLLIENLLDLAHAPFTHQG
jgi:phenylpropionate dioxygenase-like ring-hydroxylating dioxygenase large terminal subunit